MRTIQFRAWDKVNQKMVSHSYLECHRSGFRLFDEDWAKQYELMQYTGLKDKTGKEIYEGDIVRANTGGVGKVKFGDFMVEGHDYYSNFCNAGWYVQFNGGDDETADLDPCDEIIGNIYENPELLTNEK